MAGALALLCESDEGAAPAAEPRLQPSDLPEIVADASAGDWIVDRFAGNSTAGPVGLGQTWRDASRAG